MVGGLSDNTFPSFPDINSVQLPAPSPTTVIIIIISCYLIAHIIIPCSLRSSTLTRRSWPAYLRSFSITKGSWDRSKHSFIFINQSFTSFRDFLPLHQPIFGELPKDKKQKHSHPHYFQRSKHFLIPVLDFLLRATTIKSLLGSVMFNHPSGFDCDPFVTSWDIMFTNQKTQTRMT